MKKYLALIMCFVFTHAVAEFPPTIPTPTVENSTKGIIVNRSANEISFTYGICEYTPTDTQHRAVVCPPPLYTESLTGGQVLQMLIPKDILDAQGKIITHYTARITEINANGRTMGPPDQACSMDIAKNFNAIQIDANQNPIRCYPGTIICKDAQCLKYDFQSPIKNF